MRSRLASKRFVPICPPAFARTARRTPDGMHSLRSTNSHPRGSKITFAVALRFSASSNYASARASALPRKRSRRYYRETLLPQYPPGQTPPPLQQVSSRIEEILLQQRVNALFDTWLSNLRNQGQIQVLDPTLKRASAPPTTERQKNESDGPHAAYARILRENQEPPSSAHAGGICAMCSGAVRAWLSSSSLGLIGLYFWASSSQLREHHPQAPDRAH